MEAYILGSCGKCLKRKMGYDESEMRVVLVFIHDWTREEE